MKVSLSLSKRVNFGDSACIILVREEALCLLY